MSAAPFFHCQRQHARGDDVHGRRRDLASMSTWDPDYFLRLAERHRGDTGHGIFFRDIVALAPARRARRWLREGRKRHRAAGIPRAPRRRVRHHGIANIYGMTETGGNLTMWFPDDRSRNASPATDARKRRTHPHRRSRHG